MGSDFDPMDRAMAAFMWLAGVSILLLAASLFLVALRSFFR